MAQKKGLGRGLNDLLGTSEASKPSRSRNNQQNSSLLVFSDIDVL